MAAADASARNAGIDGVPSFVMGQSCCSPAPCRPSRWRRRSPGVEGDRQPGRVNASTAVDVEVSEAALRVFLADGREVSAPLAWFPRLRDATPEQQRHWRLIGRGAGIYWPDVDEHIGPWPAGAADLIDDGRNPPHP